MVISLLIVPHNPTNLFSRYECGGDFLKKAGADSKGQFLKAPLKKRL